MQDSSDFRFLPVGYPPRPSPEIPCRPECNGRIPVLMRTAASTLMILLVLASLSFSCGRKNPVNPLVPQKTQLPSSATEPEAGPYVVVGHLVHRDRVVTVKTGG